MSNELREHGGVIDDELVWDSTGVLDLSVNVNPYGPSPNVLSAIRGAPVHRYPEPTAKPVREALARTWSVSPESVIVGPGAVDLMWTLVRAVVEPRDTVVVVEPAFSEFAAAADVARARVVAFRTDDDDFVVDAARLGAVVRRERPKLVYLGTPGNPSGRVVPRSTILEVAAAAESVSARLVLDESFLSLSSGFSALEVSLPPSVVRLRSSTKDHALAGIRVGYALLPPSLAARMERARPPWSTSAPAQAALLAALDARSFLIESRGALLADRRRQDEQLRSLGFRVVPSETIYALVDVGNGAAFRRRLLARHGVLVRDCSSFGLPNYIRVCARPKPDDARIVAAFARESRES